MEQKVAELLERIRATAQVAADAAVDTARAAGKKAGYMVDVAKLNVQLFDLNGEMDAVLRKMGSVMYNTHLGKQSDGSVDELLAEADQISQRREALKERIAVLRQSRVCAGCGGVCGREDRFCKSCGAPL